MVTVLIENSELANNGLIAEHGLSMFIELRDKKILLDAGASGAFMKNAGLMGIDVSEADYVVLSHGHYDHAGGFEAYLDENTDKKIYAMKSAIEDYYSGSGGSVHEIGIPKVILDKYMDNFVLIEDITKLYEGIYLVPHSTKGLEGIGERAKLYRMIEDELIFDDFSHELSLVIEAEEGLMIFNSCSHAGIMNILDEVRQAFPGKKLHSFFGGLHMKGKCDGEVICTFSEEEIKKIVGYIEESGLERIYTGHCTGEPAIKLLKKYLGDKLEVLYTGLRILC